MLFFSRRFFPFFIVQFFGAFNDNLFKNAMLIYFSLMFSAQTLSLYTNLAMALFILPMFIFSAWSGLVAESIEKKRLIVLLKIMEILIMSAGVFAFLWQQPWLMMGVLCLLGMQSAFFGPVKYGILPERLKAQELMLGNGLVEAGTFLAILTGTILGADLVARGFGQELQIISFKYLYAAMLSAAGIGLVAACFVPKQSSGKQEQLPPFKPWTQTKALLSYTYGQKPLFQAILANSWFWLLGAVLLTQIPQFSKDVLGANPQITTYLLALFSIGIGIGSIAAAKLTAGRIETGLSVLAAWLMLPFLLGIALSAGNSANVQSSLNFAQFYRQGDFWTVSILFFGMAFTGGMYIVPLYAKLQHQSEEGNKSRIIAANNIINSLAIVFISLFSVLILSILGLSMRSLFLIVSAAHIAVAVWLFRREPQYSLRLIAILMSYGFYRLRIVGKERLPQQGAALLICNHVSYMDSQIIIAASRRRVRFMIYYLIYRFKPLTWLFKSAGTIPIAGKRENAQIFNQAFDIVSESLKNGEQVLIFPEGKLTTDGEIGVFQRGAEFILKRDPVPVIPLYIDNLWGSFFSRHGGLFKGKPRKFRALISVYVGEALPPDANIDDMRAAVKQLEMQAKTARGI